MKYFVRVGGEEHEVVLDGDGVHVDGEDVVGARRRGSTERRCAW